MRSWSDMLLGSIPVDVQFLASTSSNLKTERLCVSASVEGCKSKPFPARHPTSL